MKDRIKILRVVRTDDYSVEGDFSNVVELQIDGKDFIEWLDDDFDIPTDGTAALGESFSGADLPDDIEPGQVWEVIEEYLCAGFDFENEEEDEAA